VFYIEPKSQNKVDDNGTTKSEKGNVNEVQANGAGAYAKLVSQVGAHAESIIFYIFFNIFHLSEQYLLAYITL
jgi:hypothetical protein